MNKNLFIPILLGTARQGRNSEKVAVYLSEQLKNSEGVETAILDPREFHLSATDKTKQTSVAKKYQSLIIRADAFVIVSPEYNHGYPGELKMMLDMMYEEYNRKPVGFAGVSNGRLGGVRAIEQLRLLAIELQMVPIHNALYFSGVGKLFDDAGIINDASYDARTLAFIEELLWYAKALKSARG